MKFLIIDSNVEQNKKIKTTLTENWDNVVCETAFDLERGLELGLANRYDLIVLAHNSIKSETKKFITTLRLNCSIPLIILSSDNDIATKIDFLNSGADNCLPYDCDENEFIAYANAVLRRFYHDFGVNLYEFKNLQVNFFERSVKIDGEKISIVAKMYDLFEYLIRHKEIILSKITLFNRIWGVDSETTFSVVEVYVSKLRKILEPYGLSKHLLTIKNEGYSWTEKENPNN